MTTNSPAAWVAEYTGTPWSRSTRGDSMDSSWKSRSGCVECGGGGESRVRCVWVRVGVWGVWGVGGR